MSGDKRGSHAVAVGTGAGLVQSSPCISQVLSADSLVQGTRSLSSVFSSKPPPTPPTPLPPPSPTTRSPHGAQLSTSALRPCAVLVGAQGSAGPAPSSHVVVTACLPLHVLCAPELALTATPPGAVREGGLSGPPSSVSLPSPLSASPRLLASRVVVF